MLHKLSDLQTGTPILPVHYTWILGQGGMIGSHIETAVHALGNFHLHVQKEPFAWSDFNVLKHMVDAEVKNFAAAVSNRQGPWLIIWAAGNSVVGSDTALLQNELEIWNYLLSAIGQEKSLLSRDGTVFLASSAGALYGHGTSTEDSPVSPFSPYGETKLKEESLLQIWSARTGIKARIGRISSLYGPLRNFQKRQGLIAHLSRAIILEDPLPIYVPMQTRRDYLYVADCAEHILTWLSYHQNQESGSLLKIFAAERTASISELIDHFRVITGQNPPVIFSPKLHTADYPPSVEFCSIHPPKLVAKTSLEEGIGIVHAYNIAAHKQGLL